MSRTLIDQLGPDSIVRFERAAPLRLTEGDVLASRHPLAAIYLYGYVVEMLLKAAYFRNARFGITDEIDRDARNRSMALARSNNLMSWDPHDIRGWAQFLVWDKATLHFPAYEPNLGRQIIAKSVTVYENWRPQMRYRNTTPAPTIVNRVRTATEWISNNYSKISKRSPDGARGQVS